MLQNNKSLKKPTTRYQLKIAVQQMVAMQR